MINMYVCSEAAVRDLNLMDDFVISITSPGQEHPNIIGTNIHRFHFHDVQQVYELSDGRLIRPMDESIAEAIVDAAIKNIKKDKWIIHCEIGISRSPGVAIGLSKYLTQYRPTRKRLKDLYPSYNKHVATLIENAFHAKMGEMVAKKVHEVIMEEEK